MNNGGGGTLVGFEFRLIRDSLLSVLSVPFTIKVIPNRFHQDPRGFNQTLDVVCIEVILQLYVDKLLGCFHGIVLPSKVVG